MLLRPGTGRLVRETPVEVAAIVGEWPSTYKKLGTAERSLVEVFLPLRLRRYQSTVMGSFQTVELIETFINYQESIKRCIALTVDPATSASGTPALKVGCL